MAKSNLPSTIQKVELPELNQIYCPFCGSLVINLDSTSGEISPCEHTLFVAHDKDFEFVSEEIADMLGIDEDTEIEDLDRSIDELTDQIEKPNSVKFACYGNKAPHHGLYVGFSADS